MSTGVGRDERVERQQAERWRAVDEDVVELLAHRREEQAQPFFARAERHQFDFRAGEIAIRGDQGQDRPLRSG
jgi:hypothetical protein